MKIRVALAQINPTVGDLKGNKKKILGYIKRAEKYRPDIIVFPELALCGYPPEDLVLKPHFRKDVLKVLNNLIKSCKSSAIVVIGYPREKGGKVYNSAGVIYKNKKVADYDKVNLPNYGVFDEKRYFTLGREPLVLKIGSVRIGVTICEDIWIEPIPHVVEVLSGSEILINLSASPYHRRKIIQRINLLEKISKKYTLGIAYCNMIGGQDELVFDGASLVVENGYLKAIARQFQEDLLIYDFKIDGCQKLLDKVKEVKLDYNIQEKSTTLPEYEKQVLSEIEEVYQALVVGTRDYVRKNGFQKVVVGLSGGIDSSLTAVIAVDALGAENVIGVSMPSEFSSKSSVEDARKLASNLRIRFLKIPITSIYHVYLKALKSVFDHLPFDTTEENIQARIRGNILMALSNKFGYLVLTTGNKSELSTGYCTLYGDMAGGFAVLKDIPKTLVYKLARWRNEKEGKALIPENIFSKPPSAELRPGQKDQDTLPPYEILDEVIKLYIEEEKSFDQIVKAGFKRSVVKRVIEMIDKNEYKRRQAPPGIKITPRAFGKDRRMPITNRYTVK
ncbi:MAG: NAD+ synthase [Candidatus Omnitrophota bacterium]|nr:MAG: NAD+ synthase [Candidatus Omnitrophota bacterium]